MKNVRVACVRTSWAPPDAPEFFHNLFFLSLIGFNELHLLLQYSLFNSVGSGHSRFSQLLLLLLLLLLQSFCGKNLTPWVSAAHTSCFV